MRADWRTPGVLALVAVLTSPAGAALIAPAGANPKPGIALREGEPLTLHLTDRDGNAPPADVRLAWDAEALRIAASVTDRHVLRGHRAWRYGDGLLVTFVQPAAEEAVESGRFVSFGFALEGDRPVATLVNRNGTYVLTERPELAPRIEVDPDLGRVRYELALPWSLLAPFRPLADSRAGLNLVFIHRDPGEARHVFSLIADRHYDSEAWSKRRFVPLRLIARLTDEVRWDIAIRRRIVESVRVALDLVTVTRKAARASLELSVRDQEGVTVLRQETPVDVPAGRTTFPLDIPLPGKAEGLYTVEANLGGARNARETLLVVPAGRLQRLDRAVVRAARRSRGEPLAEASALTLAYHLDDVRRSVARSLPRDDPAGLAGRLDELDALLERWQRDSSVFTRPGYLLAAHRSRLDGSLQPFSLHLPEGMDPARPRALLAVLHGSGVDEVGAVQALGAQAPPDMVVAGPRGRGLSSWYTGDGEDEVLEVIAAIREMFMIDRIYLQGFSMGGYGALRIALRHPELFAGAVVVAGTHRNPGDPAPDSDVLRLVGSAPALPFLVIHGSDDPALDVAGADVLVDALRTAGHPVEYRRIAGGGHGNYDFAALVRAWLDARLAAPPPPRAQGAPSSPAP